MNPLRDLTRQAIDAELAEVEGVARWTEHVHGGAAQLTLNGRQLRAVLRVRPAYVAAHGQPRAYALPGLRTCYPKPQPLHAARPARKEGAA